MKCMSIGDETQIQKHFKWKKVDFCDTMMVNINYRLSDEKVQVSKIEVSAIVHSLMECMKYVLSRYNSGGNTDCHVGEDILQEQVKNHTLVLQCGHKLNFSFHMRKKCQFVYSYFNYWRLHLSTKRNI